MEPPQNTQPRRKKQLLTQRDRQLLEQWHTKARQQASRQRVKVALFAQQAAGLLGLFTAYDT